MEIAENIFHFNDKKALENQSPETSKAIFSHFWNSLQENTLAQEFLPKEVFQVHKPYHFFSFHPAYAASVLYKTLDSLEVFVRTVGLDKWELKIHASSHGRERFAVPKLESPAIMDQGPFPTHLVYKLDSALAEALQESEVHTGAKRRRTSEHEGNQKTPSFLNEKLRQSIKKVASDPNKQTTGSMFGNMHVYGGTTDVGLHTGGKKRNTAAPLVFSVISTMFQLAGRPSDEFKSLVAIYFISFLDELPKVNIYDARAIDRYIIVMREARPFIEELQNEKLKQKILQKLKMYHSQLYSVSYGPTQELRLCAVSEILKELSAPEFPKATPLPQISSSESKLEMSWREAKVNLMWIDMHSKVFSGSLQEAWVQLHALNVRFWMAASTLNQNSSPECVLELKKDLERLSRIVKVALDAANEGRFIMSVVIRSYELLAAIICFCFAHREVEINHEWFSKYAPAFDPKNLDRLVLDDKMAIDAAGQVRAFLEMRAKGIVPFRNHKDTMSLAKDFASNQSERAKKNRQVYQNYLRKSRQKIHKRWQKIQGRQRQLQILDAKLQRAQIDLVELTSILSQEERKAAFEYSFGTSYNIALERVEAAQTDVSRLEREIKSIERPPANLVFSLPEEENAAELLLFFMFMDDDFRHLAELGHQAECLLWHRKDIPKAEEKGQPLLSWLGTSVSCGLLGNGISQGMIRPFCPSARDITTPTPDIRSYNMRTGVFFPKVHNFCFGWEGTSPFKDLCQDSVRLFTENFDPKWTGHEPDKNTEFTMDVFLAAHPSPFRENIAPAKPEMKPNWLTREQYNAFASLRVTGRTQVRSLLNALFSNLLPLGNPCVHILIQQVLFQFGASDWKTDLEPEWNGLEAMDKFWRREVDELRHAPKSFERLLLAGIVSGYYSQFNTSFEEIAIQVSVIFDQWANDISLENRSIDIIAKQACFYGFALLCLAPVRMTFQCRRELLRLLVLYRDRLLLSQDKGDRVLEQAVMKVMGTKWPCYSEADSISDSLLTSLIQTVVESAPSDLTWSAVQYANVKSTACFEAVDSERLFSINLNNGVVLVNGKPRSFLPQSITSDNLFVRHFGAANPEVSIEGVHHYRTTHKVQDYFFYDFVIDANRQLHIFEFDSRKGFEDYERLELLDPDNIPFQPHLANQHSHWINEKKQYLLLRDKSIQSHRISFAMRPGKLLSVPPAFCFAPIEEIFQKEGQFDTVFAGLTPFVKLLSDAGFEEPRFVLVMTYQNRTIKYSLPRYGLSFTQTDQGIRSEDFKGYNVTQNQQLADTLPGFKSFLLLSSSDGENMLAVPCGEVLEQGTIKMQQDWVSARTFHTFRIHRRFHHLQPSTTLGRLHLSCLYASTGCLIPDRRTGKTGMTIAVELLRQCFQNFCFSNEELAKLRNLSKHSGLSSTLRLLVWCIYRWSRSLQVPYKRAMEEENFLNLDKMASEEYHIMQTGPYLTSAEEQIIFCRTTMKESIEEDEDSSISCIESKIADYIRVIEMERFQSLLRKEKRHCKSEFPITISTIGHRGAEGGRIREQIQADLQESYQAYCHLHVKKVISWDTELSEISREVCNKRESIETRVLDTLNMAVSTGQPFDLFAGSIGKFVSRDLIHIIYDVSLIRRLQRREDGSRWVLGIQSQVNDWALLCVLEDKICRLQRFSEQQKDIELIQEIQCARIWKPREYPRWLAFEVEQQLQIRPEQFKTVDQLLQNPRGSVIQLNMGTGKTRVMIPMLVLELSRQRRKLVRITVLPSILQEALLFYQQCLVASVQHTKLFTLPFIRDNEIDEYKVKILDEEVRRCHIYGGCLIMTPQDRNSLLLKQHDSNIYLAKLSQELIFDIIDESDAILEPSFQLVYAMGTKQDLPSRPTRCKMLQSLFSILSLGECTALLHLLADPTAFHREDTDAGCFRNLRVLKLSSEDRNHFTRSIAECFVRNPRPGFEWLKKLKKREDIEFLVTMISDPEFRDTSVVISGSPLFTLFKDDILAARGFLAYGILLHCLEARWGVSYGLRHLRDDDTQMAVPYSASDTPKRRAEFSHPDVGIAYTNLSYLHVGLTKSQFRMALDLLDTKGLSVKLSTYAVWIERVKADVPTFELDQFDKYEKVDPSNHAQFEVMHRRLNRCMEVVFFWLNEVVFPVDTMQYPQRRISSAWNLVDARYVIGFSGTDDNRFLLPHQVKQIRHTDEDLRATNGKMIDLVLSCTKSIHQIVTHESAIWKVVLDSCFRLKVQALIDTGGLMAGCKIDSVASYVAAKLKSDESGFEGFVYYSANKERWEVFEVATGRTHSIARSTLAACDCFVFFDESRCRGTDFKLRRDSSALVTLDKRLTKDKFLQGCARMRQLFPGGQSLILAGTAEIVSESSTVLSILNMIIENGIETVERGLRTYMQRAGDFISFPKPVDDVFGLEEMYSKRFVQNESFLEYLDRVEEVDCAESQLFKRVTEHAKSIGNGVGVDGGVGVEECEKEVNVESEQNEQRNVQATKQEPRFQEDWDYQLVFSDPNRLFGSQFFRLSYLINHYGIAELRGIRWSKDVYCTRNFWITIQNAEVPGTLSPFLRLVDPFIVFPDNRVVLISLYELDNLLPLWWSQSSSPRGLSIDHVVRHTSDCPQIGKWSRRVSSETLTSIKLFRGDVMYKSEDEKFFLRQMLQDLERPIETMKQLLLTRNRLGRYEKSDLETEAYLLSLPNINLSIPQLSYSQNGSGPVDSCAALEVHRKSCNRNVLSTCEDLESTMQQIPLSKKDPNYCFCRHDTYDLQNKKAKGGAKKKAALEAAKAAGEEGARKAAEVAEQTKKLEAESDSSSHGPKPPTSSYFFFCMETRPKTIAQNPEATYAEILIILAANWEALCAKEKQKYERKAAADRERYIAEKKSYENTKAKEDEQESDEDQMDIDSNGNDVAADRESAYEKKPSPESVETEDPMENNDNDDDEKEEGNDEDTPQSSVKTKKGAKPNDKTNAAFADKRKETTKGRLPIHKLCYTASTSRKRDLIKILRAASAEEKNQKDDSGMTPFHIIATSALLRKRLLRVLLDAYPVHTLAEKDSNGKTMMDYLFLNVSSKGAQLIKVVLKKAIVEQMNQFGLEYWKPELSSLVGSLNWKGDCEVRRSCMDKILAKLGFCVKMEMTFLLELALWKMKIWQTVGSNCSNNSKRRKIDRDCCRTSSGAAVAVPYVVGFLWNNNTPELDDASMAPRSISWMGMRPKESEGAIS